MKKIYSTILFLVLIIPPSIAICEYYQYIDKNGVKHFTDDQGAIPEQSIDDVIKHKDKYDYMSKEELKKEKQKELIEEKNAEKKRKSDLKESKRKAAIQAKADHLKKIRTKVSISNNQILVPVTLAYDGNKITTTLLLDTGANTTVINDSVAKELKIKPGKKSYARVAGGGVVQTEFVTVDYIKVGSKKIAGKAIFILSHKGPQERHKGLLGLDFLKNFNYTIDYKKQYINWKE